jgi:hypothetical protein
MGRLERRHGLRNDAQTSIIVGWDNWDRTGQIGTNVLGQDSRTIGTGQGHPL